MKAYGVIIGASKVTTVYAKGLEAARKEAARQLGKPGRYGILKQWIAGGKVIRDEKTCSVYRLRHSGSGPDGNTYTLKGE